MATVTVRVRLRLRLRLRLRPRLRLSGAAAHPPRYFGAVTSGGSPPGCYLLLTELGLLGAGEG